MKRSSVLSAAVAVASIALAMNVEAQTSVLGPAGGVTTLSGGKTLVVAPRPAAVRPDARLAASTAPTFQPLPVAVFTEAVQAAGMTVTGTPAGGPYTLSLRTPFLQGRGFLNGSALGLNGNSNTLQIGGDGWVGVWSLGSATATKYMLHFQVSEIANSTVAYIIKFMDGSTMNVPARANSTQDIIVLVLLPNNTPITSSHLLASILRAGPAKANLTGVEITPM